jgi:two-component system sensor histidine kinase KdpD
VIGLAPRAAGGMNPEAILFADALARQLAVGIERDRLNELERAGRLARESERLYKVLLDSVSHELKTPLAAIEGSADALLDPLVTADPANANRRSCRFAPAPRPREEPLDMTRLESGAVKPAARRWTRLARTLPAEPELAPGRSGSTLRRLCRRLDFALARQRSPT